MEIAGSYWEILLSLGGAKRRKIDSVSYPTLNNINCSEPLTLHPEP